MRVLVACEYSGAVRNAFLDRGHMAWSCDLLPEDEDSTGYVEEMPSENWHYQCDVLELIHDLPWDLLIAHPPCTYLTSSGLHWNKRVPGREAKTTEGIAFVQALMDAPIERICIENPVGRIGTAIRKADQYIQPYEFGHDASKRTGLWLKGLAPLVADPANYVKPRIVAEKQRWANQTDSGQNRLGPSEDRWKIRSETYQGIADAMADQWGAGE